MRLINLLATFSAVCVLSTFPSLVARADDSVKQGRDVSSIRPHITSKGLSKFVTSIFPLIEQMAKSTDTIPDINGNGSHFDYAVRNVQLVNIAAPNVEVEIGTPQALEPRITGITAELTLEWQYAMDTWPHMPSGSGSARVAISDASAVLVVEPIPGAYKSNKPPMRIREVKIDLSNFDLTIEGAMIAWFYNMLIGLIKDRIKTELTDTLRKMIKNVVNKELSDAWKSIPFVQVIEEVTFNMGMVADPAVVPSHTTSLSVDGSEANDVDIPAYIELYTNGVWESPDPECLAIPRTTLSGGYDCSSGEDLLVHKEKSLSVIIDQYVLETAMCAFHKKKELVTHVKDKHIAPEAAIRLNTESFAQILPPLADMYPMKRDMSLYMSTSKVPTIKMSQAGITIFASIDFDIQVHQDGKYTKQATFNWDAQFMLDVELENTHMNAHAEFKQGVLTLKDAPIGEVDTDKVQYFLDTVLLPHYFKRMTDEILGSGFDLPIPGNFQPVDAMVVTGDGCLAVGTDFMYVPSEPQLKHTHNTHT
eukprot:GDKI01032174.1.p1 GENE.GDKI01032174.1~~GDKI01032174.1.p1  ORF type:complete len:534 (+),score=147.27 GDKI01032174.1:150-1751(+)